MPHPDQPTPARPPSRPDFFFNRIFDHFRVQLYTITSPLSPIPDHVDTRIGLGWVEWAGLVLLDWHGGLARVGLAQANQALLGRRGLAWAGPGVAQAGLT